MPYLPKAFLLLWIATALLLAQQRSLSDSEVMRVHRSAILIDTHNDVTSKTVTGFDIGQRSTEGHTDLARLREGGVAGVFFAVYVGANFVKTNQSAHRALEMIDTVRRDIAGRYPGDFALRASAAGVEAAHKQNRIAALMGIEGGHAIEDSLRLLREFYELGVRYMTLTHVNSNSWADSSGDMDRADVKHHNGLTDFGRDVIHEMNRLGMLVDVSHVSDKTFWDALETSSAPVFASHSSCRALSNIPRNMTDEMIVAMAKKGGVIQINFGCEFLSQKSADASKRLNLTARYRAIQEKYKRDPEKERAALQALEKEMGAKIPPATLDDVVAHIDHVVKIAGIEAVGIGSDFDGVTCVPTDLEDVSKFPNLTRALLEKGYSAAEIRKIYGGNTLRVMAAAEKTAHGL